MREELEAALAVLAACPSRDVTARARHLYGHWYAVPRAGATVPPGTPRDLVEGLRAAHAATDRWERGWRIADVGPRGQALLRRGDEVRLLERCDLSSVERPGLLPRPGDEAWATARRDRVDPGDGWWRTAGAAWAWTAPPARLVRLFYAVELPALDALVARLTALLDTEPEPWMLKCATAPQTHARADATVLFVTAAAAERHAAALAAAAPAGAPDHRPPLTLRVARGVAAAVDPGGDESFGSHRCRLIAEAGGDVDAVAARLRADGIDPARPWARAGDPALPWPS